MVIRISATDLAKLILLLEDRYDAIPKSTEVKKEHLILGQSIEEAYGAYASLKYMDEKFDDPEASKDINIQKAILYTSYWSNVYKRVLLQLKKMHLRDGISAYSLYKIIEDRLYNHTDARGLAPVSSSAKKVTKSDGSYIIIARPDLIDYLNQVINEYKLIRKSYTDYGITQARIYAYIFNMKARLHIIHIFPTPIFSSSSVFIEVIQGERTRAITDRELPDAQQVEKYLTNPIP